MTDRLISLGVDAGFIASEAVSLGVHIGVARGATHPLARQAYARYAEAELARIEERARIMRTFIDAELAALAKHCAKNPAEIEAA